METDVRILKGSAANDSRKLAASLAPAKLSSVFTHYAVAGKRKYLFILVAALAAVLVVFAAHAIGTDSSNDIPNNGGPQGAANQSGQPSSSPNNSPDGDQPKSGNNTNESKSSSSTTVTVNGQSVDVPQSGSYDKTVDVPGGQARVSGSNSSTSSGSSASNSSTSSTNVNVSSQ
jgi:hypothetical protein